MNATPGPLGPPFGLDEAITVVSGLPRSGTSMMMRMLEAGGVPVLSDDVRGPDEVNPRGYFEFERVKTLPEHSDKSWLAQARGKAIKVVSPLLEHLPTINSYRVIFMCRDLREIIASQNAMLIARGHDLDGADDARLLVLYERHLDAVRRVVAQRPCFRVIEVSYADALARPHVQAARVEAFLEQHLNLGEMAKVVERTLHHHAGPGEATRPG